MKIPALFSSAVLGTALMASSATAAELTVQIVNTTRGLHFTPLLVTTHPAGTALFTSGQAASASLQTMAEGGDIAALESDLAGLGAGVAANPAAGLLAPGASTTANITGGADTNNVLLSVVAMILPSNDGFIGLNSITVPSAPGRYVYNVPVYDAGTENNDEIAGSGAPGQPGFPVPPPLVAQTDTGGTGRAGAAEGFVHIHRGSLGDTNASGGETDIDSRKHRWLNPAARVIVTVN